jgi:capsular polysaccharide biosynthesis protein
MIKYLKHTARVIGLKGIYIRSSHLFLKWKGLHLLTIRQTNAFMKPYLVKVAEAETILLPQIINYGNIKKNIFEEKRDPVDPVHVWDCNAPTGKSVRISKNGSVIIRRKVLCTDSNYRSFSKDLWKADERIKKTAPVVIALFSHFQDGIFYGGYYDYVFLVTTKLCRIIEALPDQDLSNVIISYPLFNASYETDYLRLLDINPSNLVDSSKYQVISQRVLTGNSANWYPNLDDIMHLKQRVDKKFKPVKTPAKRIYVSRAYAYRRRILNETELIDMLKKFDFLVIEDKNRSVTEQISIYYNASFILGPHGASFSNIIWCMPGTHLFELFSPNYAPNFFLYLAEVMDMKYSAFFDGPPDSSVDYLEGLVEDIYVPIAKLEACLSNIFKDN